MIKHIILHQSIVQMEYPLEITLANMIYIGSLLQKVLTFKNKIKREKWKEHYSFSKLGFWSILKCLHDHRQAERTHYKTPGKPPPLKPSLTLAQHHQSKVDGHPLR